MKEVVIVGGGVVGLWCAWHLQQEGMQVTVVDKSNLSDGCSFGNAGMIVPSHFTPLASPGMIAKGLQWMFKKSSPFYIRPRLNAELVRWLWLFYKSSTRKHVAESAHVLSDMHIESRELYKNLRNSPGFDFGFEHKGIIMLFKTRDGEKEELDAMEAVSDLGMEAEYLDAEQLKKLETQASLSVRGGVYYPGDAHIKPHLFMRQMEQHLQSNGVSFWRDREVVFLEDKGKLGGILHFANREKIDAQLVVLCAGAWSGHLMKRSGWILPVQAGKGYGMTQEYAEHMPAVPSILHEARVAVTPMGTTLRVTGTLEISGMDDRIRISKVTGIRHAIKEYYPEIDLQDPGRIWFGYRPCSPDGMPYIGRWKENSSLILATGHAMMGLSLAPATGRMVRDEIIQGQRCHPKVRPDRF